MSQGHRSLKERMLNRLLGATGWTLGPVLAEGLSTSQPAIEDALADLVLEGCADFKAASGYRLKGTELCRQAMRTLKHQRKRRAIAGQAFDDVYRVGVAELRADLGLVMYELEFPNPPAGPDFLGQQLAQMNQIINFAIGEKTHG